MEKRMAKGWTLLATNAFEFGKTETKAERIRKEKRFRDLIKRTSKLKLEELIQEGFDAEKVLNAKKAAYEKAKKEGRLLSLAEKNKLKAEKKEARRAKRLAKKVA